MGFNSVYRVLQEVFPQVDARILRAVAIEHSKDADAAVEAILVEVVPYLSKRSPSSSSSNETEVLPDKSGAVEDANNNAHSDGALLVVSTCLDKALNCSSYFDANGGHDQVWGANGNAEFISLGKCEESSVKVGSDMTSHVSSITSIHENNANDDHDQVRGNIESEEIISIGKYQESSVSPGSDQSSHITPTTSKHGVSDISGNMNCNVYAKWEDFDGPDACDSDMAIHGGSHQEQACLDGNLLEVENYAVQLAPSRVQEHSPIAPESSLQLVVVPDTLIPDCEKLKQSGSFDAAPKKETSISEMVDLEDLELDNSAVQLAPSRVQEHSPNAPKSSQLVVVPEALITDCEKLKQSGSFDAAPEKETSISEMVHLEDLEVENSVVQLAPSRVQEHTPNAPESSQLVVVPDALITDCEKLKQSGSFDAAPEKETSISEMVHLEDESTLNAIVTRSGQICRIDLLEDIIEDARSNKKTLFSAMESVISLMREVELQEEAAEQAKEEAARGGLDILTRVEDIKQMLRHAKEANDMHTGEVYAEKAILGTEVRELQSRLLSLSDERDKALGILDEMHQTLEARFAAAEEERKVAEQEKLEKEKSARNALAEQELIMEKVVEESKILKQEAEENSKLLEFLMDRGRVVDMLQGEISVICQDVKLLKEKFDERVPLSKSLSSSQTSCILASSSSSLKSMAPDQVPEQADSSESPKNTSPASSINDQLLSGEERAKEDRKALVDDGWEFFDNREVYM